MQERQRRTNHSESFFLWGATFLHNPWHRGPEARWMPCAPLSRRRHTSPAQRYYITPEGGSPGPACKAKPITGRTLGAQGQRPGGAINPHAHQGVSTFGNTGKHRPGPRSRSRSRPRREAPEPSSPGSQPSRQPHINIFKFLVVFFRKISYNDMRNVSYMGSPQGMRFSFMQKKESLLFHERI